MPPLLGGSTINGAVNIGEKLEVFSDIVFGRNHKRYLDEALTEVHTLLSIASQLLDQCRQDHGFDGGSFDWFSRVSNLINNFKFGRIVKEIPAEWISVRENIGLFSVNGMYKPADYRAVSLASEDWRTSVHRVTPLIFYAIHIGKRSKTLSDEAKKLISDYKETLKRDLDAGTLYKPRYFPHPKQMDSLVSKATYILDVCPEDSGFDPDLFDWFVQVKLLIDEFENKNIVVSIPDPWSRARENIMQFWENGKYKPAAYTSAPPTAQNLQRLACAEFATSHGIKKESDELARSAGELLKEYGDKLRQKHEAKTLFKKRPGPDFPHPTQMNSLVSRASEILDNCPNDSGIDGIWFDWFVRVMDLIDEFEKTKFVVSIPDPWSRARENIRQFWENGMYKPAEYTAAPPNAPNCQPLTCAEGATGNGINKESEKLASSAGELLKEYDGNLRQKYEAKTLFKKRPRCQLPRTYCDVPPFVPFKSRSETMEKIRRSLHDSKPRITVIYGPGGIGKTTILAEVAEKAEDMFSRVVYAEVSRNPDVSIIQDQIANQLQSLLPVGDNARSTALQDKMKELKRVLVILDDVWENHDDILGAIGIPALPGVKVLVGTRRRDLPFIEATETIQIGVLSEVESWSLLCQVTPAARADDIRQFAEQVRDECRGLPLALVVIGKALYEKGRGEWELAVHYLKKSIPPCLEVKSALYKVIKYSYDHLPTGNRITPKVFLHCCLFPELEEVYIADLQRHLDTNEEVKSLGNEEDRNLGIEVDLGMKIAASINTLEHYGLLEKHSRPRGIVVKMHDVVRDVAVYIAREEKYAFIAVADSRELKFDKQILGTYKRMSLSNINEHHELKDWQELHTLLVRGTTFLPGIFSKEMASSLFSFWGKKKLATSLVVLDLSGSGMSRLPSSMETLINVQTLLLNGCKNLEKIDEIVKLTKLKVLSLRESVVKSLPQNMKNLLLLEVLYWENGLPPEDTDPKVTHEHFEGSCKLNELSMDRSITVGAFRAITNLNHLTAVKLYVTNSALSSAEIFAGENHPCSWEKFTIYNHFGSPNLSSNKNIYIEDLPEVKHGVKVLLREAEEVVIKNCFQNATRSVQSTSAAPEPGIVLTEVTGEGTLRKTSVLRVTDCANIRYLTSEDGVKLTELKELELARLETLIGIIKPHGCAGTGNFFRKLRKVILNSCDQIKCVIPNDVHQEVYNTLEVISVRNSKRVEYIFHPEPNCSASFSKLTSIELANLEVLSCIWNETPPHGIFECLEELTVRRCNMLTSIFTTQIAAQLKKLKKLTVEDNSEMIEIVSTDGDNAVLSERKTFDCVTHLSLQGLPNLQHFNRSHTNYDWSALVKLNLRACPVLTELPIGENSAKGMDIIDLHSSDDLEWYKNLRNQEILKRFGTWRWRVNDGERHTDPVRRNSSAIRIA